MHELSYHSVEYAKERSRASKIKYLKDKDNINSRIDNLQSSLQRTQLTLPSSPGNVSIKMSQ